MLSPREMKLIPLDTVIIWCNHLSYLLPFFRVFGRQWYGQKAPFELRGWRSFLCGRPAFRWTTRAKYWEFINTKAPKKSAYQLRKPSIWCMAGPTETEDEIICYSEPQSNILLWFRMRRCSQNSPWATKSVNQTPSEPWSSIKTKLLA